MIRAERPVVSAAIRVVPDPANGSSTIPPRFEQSMIGSATSATGLTVWEAISLGAHLGLGNLTLIVDANGLQGLGTTVEITNLEPLGEKLASFGWDVSEVPGHDHDALREVLGTPSGERPPAVIARTVKGYGWTSMENDVMSHYRGIPAADRERVLAELEARAAA